jgi:hypothetical protein
MSGTPEVSGYRKLDEIEIAMINDLKAREQELAGLLNGVGRNLPGNAGRSMALARTYLEIGFMFAIKAIARPTGGMGDPGA